MFNKKSIPGGWDFWLKWALATTLGLGLLTAILVGVVTAVGEPLWDFVSNQRHTPILLLREKFKGVYEATGVVVILVQIGLVGALGGAIIGTIQQLVLRRWIQQAGWWITATAAGWGGGGVITFCLAPAIQLAFGLHTPESEAISKVWVGGPLMAVSIMTGFMQWLVLRRWVYRASWWIVGNPICGLIGLGLGLGLTFIIVRGIVTLWSMETIDDNLFSMVVMMIAVITGFFIGGAFTGVLLEWLFRKPRLDNQTSTGKRFGPSFALSMILGLTFSIILAWRLGTQLALFKGALILSFWCPSNCPGVSLPRTDLSGVGFHGANFNKADMSGADLTEADLSQARLQGTKLRGANLNGTDLRGANLLGADLSSASLSGTIVDNTTQIDPKWRLVWEIVNQDAVGRDLRGIDLRETNLTHANLSGANLSGANLTWANLEGTKLTEAHLQSADLRWSNLSWGELTSANLEYANLEGVDLIFAKLEWANLAQANLQGADLSSLETNLTDANLTGANLSGTNQVTNLTDANLTGANLSGTNLQGTNLTGANLSGTNLQGTNLTDANLTGADLTGAYLTGTDLTGANLTGTNLNSAFEDDYTHWPSGFMPPSTVLHVKYWFGHQ